MSAANEEPTRAQSIVERVKGVLFSPAEEWGKIEAEPTGVGQIYAGYVCLLAAIPAVAGLVGRVVFGTGVFGAFYHWPIGAGVAAAIVGYVLALVAVYVVALIINALAPTFGGERNPVQAFKVAAYANTAGWVAGAFQIFPPLALLGVVGEIYGLYLLYLGLPRLMKAPQEKALGYTAATVVAVFVILLIVDFISSGVMMASLPAAAGLMRPHMPG